VSADVDALLPAPDDVVGAAVWLAVPGPPAGCAEGCAVVAGDCALALTPPEACVLEVRAMVACVVVALVVSVAVPHA
jgi:hypothetical protein